MIGTQARERLDSDILGNFNTFLVDGFVAGRWKLARERNAARDHDRAGRTVVGVGSSEPDRRGRPARGVPGARRRHARRPHRADDGRRDEAMRTRRLGSSAIDVGEIGLGCMPMNWAYVGDASDTESIAVIHRALDLGMTLLDTSDVYGPFTNEELVGRALVGHRERAVVATKAGLVVGPSGGYPLDKDGRPGAHPRGGRGVAPPAPHRRDRSVPAPSHRPAGAVGGVVGSHGRARARREGARARHVGGERRRAGAGTRDPSRRVGPVGALAVVHRTSRRRRAVVRRPRRRVHPVRAAGPRLPHRHADDRHDGSRRLPLDAPALHAGARSTRTRRSSNACAPSRTATEPRPPRSRSRGSWRRASTSSRSRAPDGCVTSRRTPARPRSR